MSKHVCKLSKVGICKLSKAGLSLFAIIWIIGCTTKEIDHNYDNMVYVNQSSLELFYGDTQQLTASPTESTFEWTSADPSIATVDNNGLVTATGAGRTQITAAQGEWSKLIDVVVSIPTSKNVLARPGKERVLIEVTLDNEKVQKVSALCKNDNSSIEQDVNYKSGVLKFYYNNLKENNKYNFVVTCIDRFGNESAPINASANVYGDSFQTTLSNRAAEVATRFGNGLAIKWKDISGSCMLNYKNESGKEVTKYIPSTEKNSYLLDFGSDLSYATYAIPESTAADTFYVAPVLINTYEDLRSTLTSAAPCVISVFNFDLGGEGIGYHDNSANNEAGYNYRSDKGDDNSPGVDLESGMNIGYTGADEWQMFTLDVQDAGTYAFDLFRSVNNGNGGYYSLEVDGVKTNSVHMQNDNAWSDFKWQHETYSNPDNQPKLTFTKGKHTVKLVIGEGGNFNYKSIRFTYK